MFRDRRCFEIAVFALAASSAWGQVTRRVSVDSAGNEADSASWLDSPSLSADGRWVVFDSNADNLVPGDSDFTADVFVHDRLSGTTECASVDPSGAPAGGGSCSITADGRFVVFQSRSPGILPGLSGQFSQIFVRDRSNGTTELVSAAPNGTEGDSYSAFARPSADGRWIAFCSGATNLVPGAGSGSYPLVFLRDRQNGTTELVSLSSGGAIADSECYFPSVSSDGRYVAYESDATNLVTGDTNGDRDIFLRDRLAGTTERISVATGGAQADGLSSNAAISASGRFVAFESLATNLVGGDTNACGDVFLRDLQSATTERLSVSSAGIEANDRSLNPWLSADGRYLVFGSWASNLVPGDTNLFEDILLRDRQLGTTERVSVSSGGAQALGSWSEFPSISDDGRFVSFRSGASNLVPLDTNGLTDVFVRDRLPGSETTAFTSLCDPGSGSVIVCPCSNPPSGSGRGCDNSAGSGGAILSASGDTELSADGLAFTATGETPSALSILAQGSALVPNGIVYGQGVRCIGGSIRRLYTAPGQGGTVTFPDFQAGDPPVSVRSAQRGDLIQPGQSRWYLVYYRDTVVLGGCPATSTFNSTQTGEIAWSF